MSCYLRHLKEVFTEAGISEPTDKANRKRLDLFIAELVGDETHRCPETWRRVKDILADPNSRQKFIADLRGFETEG